MRMASEQQNSPVNNNNGTNSDAPNATLTLRMIMQGKEVGSIIGKKGDNVKKFREESGAKINISDSSCPERIVTITGTTDSIFKAFTMICKKFEEFPFVQDVQNTSNNQTGTTKPPVTIRLIVPASQCGSLIGKGGAKIKEIREVTGASIQVASEMLPNSTERTVTISGTAESITQCIYHICCVMLESPPKGATIPYRPKPAMPPVIFAGGQAFTVQGQYAIPAPDQNYARSGGMLHFPAAPPQLTKMALQQGIIQPGGLPFLAAQQGMIPTAVPASLPGVHIPAGIPTAAMTQPAFGRPATTTAASTTQTHEMTIPNDLIGCIIGRGGAKINEIRQLSGANIKIANADEGSTDRKVTITGTPETINAAQYLINASIEMHKNMSTLETTSNPVTSTPSSLTSPNPMAIPLNQLIKPLPLLGLNMGLLDNRAAAAAAAITAQTKTHLTSKIKTASSLPTANKKPERAKFAPY